MSWNLDSDRPIFAQLVEYMEIDIVSGKYKAGDKLPTVRELAIEASVNPNTMQKAFSELERDGLVFSQRTSGRFVTEDQNLIEKTRKEFAQREADNYLNKMQQLGIGKDEAIEWLRKR